MMNQTTKDPAGPAHEKRLNKKQLDSVIERILVDLYHKWDDETLHQAFWRALMDTKKHDRSYNYAPYIVDYIKIQNYREKASASIDYLKR